MATMLIKGTERKIEILTDILCDSPPEWYYITKSGGKSVIKFEDIDDAKVMRAMYKRLQTRKDLGFF